MTGPQSSAPTEAARRTSWIVLALVVITATVYLPALRCGFVDYDDGDYVFANPHVQEGFSWKQLRWAFTSGHAANWHPLTWISHMVDWQLFGAQPAGHHAVSLLLHVLNTVLVFFLFRAMTGDPWSSVMLTAFFGLHSLHVESVAWVSERKDLLSAILFLLSLKMYVRYAKSGSDGKVAYVLALVLFGLGLMAKPMLVTLPFVLLLLDFWPLQRLSLGEQGSTRKRWGPLFLEKAPFFALSLASAVITFLVQQRGGAVSTALSLGARVANAVVSYARYLGKTIWPENLSVLYPHPGQWPTWQVIGSVVLLVLVCVAVVVARRRPWLVVGWCWFLGMLVPVIGVVQVGIQSMADRYMYLPLIGVLMMVIGEVQRAPGFWKRGWLAGGLVALVGCGLLTWRQTSHWRNTESLFGHAVRVTKNNYLAYNNLGFFLSGKGRVAEAIENYRQAIAIQPNYEDAHNNLGHALAGQRKYDEAIHHYEVGLRIRPKHTELHNNLGNALAEIGRLDEAIAHFQFVLKQNPKHADGHNNFGIALAMKGQLGDAIPHFEKAIELKPNNASAHSNLGNAFAAQRRFEEAAREYQISLRLKPDEAQAHNNLGNVLAEQGRLDEAIDHYEKALALNADNPEAHYNLGMSMARKGNIEGARAHYQEALRLKPDYDRARQQLLRLP